MYIMNEEIPKTCLKCPAHGRCDVWRTIFDDKYEPYFMDVPTPKPMQYACCKIIAVIPKPIERFYKKWIKGECRHICFLCNHRKECDLIDD